MDRVWASRVLRERGGSLTNKELYRLTLLATDDEGKAQEARERRVLEELRRNETPDV
jgi:hypothetical protein